MKPSLALVRAALWRGALFALLWWALTDGRPGSWAVGSARRLGCCSCRR
jgi:hypothetical protein